MNYKGGKNGSGVYQRLISMIPKHRVYIEAFLGSGSILRRKRPAEYSIAFELDRVAIDQFVNSLDADGNPLAAAKFAPARSDYIDLTERRSARIVGRIYQSDAIAQLQTKFVASSAFWGFNDPADVFIYLDPPYPNAVRSSPGRIYKFELMDEQEHRELLTAALAVPCPLMISGYDNDLYNGMLKGWRKETIATTNRAGSRVIETVWLNFPEPGELHDYSFAGGNYRDRWRIEKRRRNWIAQLREMSPGDRAVLLNDISALNLELSERENEIRSAASKKMIARAARNEKKLKPARPKAAVITEPELFE